MLLLFISPWLSCMPITPYFNSHFENMILDLFVNAALTASSSEGCILVSKVYIV